MLIIEGKFDVVFLIFDGGIWEDRIVEREKVVRSFWKRLVGEKFMVFVRKECFLVAFCFLRNVKRIN